MNTQTNLSIIDHYARSRQMERKALEATLFKTIMPDGATMEDLVGFLQIASRFDLDPWAKEIYCIKSRGKVSTYVGIDGYAKIVNRQPEYDGVAFTYDQDGDGKITAITCSMYRKDRSRPTVVTEFYDECVPPPNKDGRISEAWTRSPSRMLRHRAFVQAARLSFGISGALDEGIDTSALPAIDITPASPEPEPQRPSPKKTPPSPGQAAPAPAPEPEPEKAKLPAEALGGFPMDQFLDALGAAATIEELKTLYEDFEIDEALDRYPDALDRAQDAFVKAQKRISG